jgi:hypothetical protein
VSDQAEEPRQGVNRKPRLTVRGVILGALALYRLEPGRIALASLVTFIPVDLLAVALHGWSTHLLELGHTGLSEGAEFVIFLIVTGGQVFLAGVLDRLVAVRLANKSSPTLLRLFRGVPLGRLIAADLLVSAIASIASLAFVIPGVIAFALFGIVGPVINIEDRDAVGALIRSATLVYPHIWVACVVIVVPLAVEIAVEDWYLRFAHRSPLLADLVVSVGLSLTVRAFISLLEVFVGHALIHADRASLAREQGQA